MKIVVPCDFTEVTEFALRYAARIAAVQDPTAEIHLLHVVEKGLLGQADEVEKLKGQLAQYVDLAKGIGQQLR
ncbi:MAG: universal stress protein [Bacteroidia bacterium]|nr:universal stress protein [Bacteroidia bacterium]